MKVGEDRVSNNVVVREREGEISFSRFKDVGWRVLNHPCRQPAFTDQYCERAYLIGEFSLTSSSKHSEQFKQNFDDASFAEKRGEASDEVVKISSRY